MPGVAVLRHQNSKLKSKAKQKVPAEKQKSSPSGHGARENDVDCCDRARGKQSQHPRAGEEIKARVSKNQHGKRRGGDDDDRTEDVNADQALVLSVVLARAHERVVAGADDADEYAAESRDRVQDAEGRVRRNVVAVLVAEEVAANDFFDEMVQEEEHWKKMRPNVCCFVVEAGEHGSPCFGWRHERSVAVANEAIELKEEGN